MRQHACFAGVIALLAASLVGCAGRSALFSTPAPQPIVAIGGGATDQAHAGLAGGGYGPPESLQQAQQTLAREGRAGNPNYNIVNDRGMYLYAVGDH